MKTKFIIVALACLLLLGCGGLDKDYQSHVVSGLEVMSLDLIKYLRNDTTITQYDRDIRVQAVHEFVNSCKEGFENDSAGD